VSDGVGLKTLTVVLRYGRDRQSAIDGVRRVSTPGRRVYVRHDRIPRVLSGMGVSILSTSRGVMTDKDARKQRVGGELLCEVW
jgi:small subunit ribosomal protein S8